MGSSSGRAAEMRSHQKTYKLRPEDEFRSRFYGLLGRLVHAHAHT